MAPLAFLAAGFALLGLFAYGGMVQGRGDPAYIASAARAFLVPWIILALVNVWVRWWGGAPLANEAVWAIPVIVAPILAAFALWRHYRRR